ncbi:MAG: protein phosphatase 2C domain-containing protein [Proteobacteria bacterium]|nr:protein phosphatase 2C domain-containing protein [Pseudomonadota bacterium]
MTEEPAHGVRVASDTNVGKVRTTNEDSLLVEASRGLYGVFDGMGGANAGDVASQTARDAVRDYVIQRRLTMEPRALIEAALIAGCNAVFTKAALSRETHGMGTTAVACLVVDPQKAFIAHVGDSRAYLLRNSRLSALTRDHTIVEELVVRGMLTPDEAERHPYKNVLSRNLGAQATCKVDVFELDIQPGDRVLLCSDGLYGYAGQDAMQYILGSGDAPEDVARDLVELALRGGGGDNVTTIVIEAPQSPQSSTQIVRTNGAQAWWQRQQRFLQVAKERGLTRNPIVRGLDPTEALDLVALSLCQAIYHDLEKSTGVNVWTFTQNLAGGWFERGGEWGPLRAMFDILAMSARTVVDELRANDRPLGFLVDVAVSRALVVAELALGGLLAEQLRQVDADLIQLHTQLQETVQHELVEPGDLGTEPGTVPHTISGIGASRDSTPKFLDQQTIPFLRPDRPVTNSGVANELLDAIGKTLTVARARTAPKAELVRQILSALETIATDSAGNFATAVLSAREIYGVRPVDETGIMPLFDALDHARVLTSSSVHQIVAADATRARVLHALSAAHQRLVGATTGLVLEAVAPISERLQDVAAQTVELRDQVAKAERRRADLEKRFATNVDQSLPWGSRGNTNW